MVLANQINHEKYESSGNKKLYWQHDKLKTILWNSKGCWIVFRCLSIYLLHL